MLEFKIRDVSDAVKDKMLDPTFGTEARERFHVHEDVAVEYLETALSGIGAVLVDQLCVADAVSITVKVEATHDLTPPERKPEEPEEASEE